MCVRCTCACMQECTCVCDGICMRWGQHIFVLAQDSGCISSQALWQPMSPKVLRKPASDESDSWLAALHSAGVFAGEEFSTALNELVEVEYLGQKHGPASRPMYRPDPRSWKTKAGERRDRVQVCFRWQLLGAQAVPASIPCQRNDDARARALTRPGALAALARSVPCVSWAARALAIVEQAAGTFVQVHAHALCE